MQHSVGGRMADKGVRSSWEAEATNRAWFCVVLLQRSQQSAGKEPGEDGADQSRQCQAAGKAAVDG